MKTKDIAGDHIFTLPVAAIAATSSGEIPVLRVPYRCAVTAAYWTPSANVTAHGTNFFTLAVRNRGAAAAGSAKPASRSMAATNSVAHVPEAMTLSATAADLLLAEGDVLTAEKVEAASGLTMPAGTITLHVKAR